MSAGTGGSGHAVPRSKAGGQARRHEGGRAQLALIAAVFFVPLLAAAWLYFSGDGPQPVGRTNHGALLEPIESLQDLEPTPALAARLDGRWALVYVNRGPFDEDAHSGLYTIRQLRLATGRERDRVQRVFLHGPEAPDTLFVAERHAGLITTSDDRLADWLVTKSPATLPPGGIFLVDPLGNVVMYFSPTLHPDDMIDDVNRLLKLSRIG